MNAAAIDGVRRALGELPAGRPAYRVIVTKIEDAPADTCLDDIMRAAMHATWAALAQA
ncbi:hypothetical protein [Actinoplanes friuliensis]|uniref:hypothetical protein n=1 Tax=Actinoplanes friuliensis TaxID=196914 RepID=UPI0003FA0868|nr:hypothetical protein [Actinoplanes friuliensis]